MTTNKVLYPTDFSEHSQMALRHAEALARENDATLMIVHVQEPPAMFHDTGFSGWAPTDDDGQLESMLQDVKPASSELKCTRHMLTGHPAEEIVRLAGEEGAKMIVLGTHGRRGLTRLLMGSTAEAVVRQAPCPVLTVKQPQDS